MICKEINKRAYDVQNFRLILILPLIFTVLLIFSIIFNQATYKKVDLYLVVFVSALIVVLLLINFMIVIFTLKKVVFQKDIILINGNKYQWYNVELIFNDIHELITLKWKTICIKYYDPDKMAVVETYIRCRKDEYNNIMSIRN